MKRLRWPLAFTLYGAVVGLFLLINFRNPDMTRTRLLIEFWPYYLLGLIAIAIVTYVSHPWME